MSRDDGFKTADLSTAYFRDPKVKRLRRILPSAKALAAMVLHLEVVAGSWEAGERLSADEADGPVAGTAALIRPLVQVGLLDSDGRIPERVWKKWFGPAAERRDGRKFEGLVGGLMRSLGMDKPTAVAEARRRLAVEADRRSSSGHLQADLTPALTRSGPANPIPPDPSDFYVSRDPSEDEDPDWGFEDSQQSRTRVA